MAFHPISIIPPFLFLIPRTREELPPLLTLRRRRLPGHICPPAAFFRGLTIFVPGTSKVKKRDNGRGDSGDITSLSFVSRGCHKGSEERSRNKLLSLRRRLPLSPRNKVTTLEGGTGWMMTGEGGEGLDGGILLMWRWHYFYTHISR